MSSTFITRRQFITRAGAAALAFPFIDVAARAASSERPNFVFILTDDQRYDAMSCVGGTFYRTPNMDRIAREGARFRNAFVVTSLCSPSRACFLTGQTIRGHGIKDNKTALSDEIPKFPMVLRQAGYDTAFVGKWHMGAQQGVRKGFNHWVSFKGQGVYWNPKLDIDGESQQATGYMTDLLTQHAVEWLKTPPSSPPGRGGRRGGPFCLYLAHKAVHGPMQPAIRHSKLYSDDKYVPPPNAGSAPGEPAWLAECRTTQHGWTAPEKADEFVQDYGRVLAGVDDSVGQVLSTLSEIGVLDNTVVIFAGDNGYFLGEHGLRDKRAMYEESIRIPLLMRYPKLVKPGTLIDEMVLNIDLCPTILDLAGEKAPTGVEGRSMRPLLSGRASNWRSEWFYEYIEEPPYRTPTVRGVRTKRWKYIEYPDIKDTAELYDLAADPGEMHNLVADSAHARVLADMRARLARLSAP